MMQDKTFSSAQEMFTAERLPMPPIPAVLAASLAAQSTYVFATRPLPDSPYGIETYVDEVIEQPDLQDYALTGFDGHGINSWAVHYYLVQRSLALFVQLPWGGAYTDAEKAAAEIKELFDWAAALQHKVAQCEQAGKVAKGWRLTVLASHVAQAGWGWAAPQGVREEPISWRSPAHMLPGIDDHLSDILAGRATPA